MKLSICITVKLILLVLVVCGTQAYNILVVFPNAVRSLNILGEGVVRHLLNAGHEVTYITVFPMKDNKHKNLRQVDLSGNYQYALQDQILNISYIINNEPKADYAYAQDFTLDAAVMTFQNEDLRKILENTNEKFDAVIADLVETDIFVGLAAMYNCPMIWLYSMGPNTVPLRIIDEAANPAYNAHYLSTNTLPFDFFERLGELKMQIHWSLVRRFYLLPKERAVYAEFLAPLIAKRGRGVPIYDDLVTDVALVLSNSHHALGNMPHTPQNFKFIGGYHIEHPPKPLPKDLQSLMDNASDGVIYFSMGSTWKSKDIPVSIKKGLLEVFGSLKQTVIWKHEEPLDMNIPKNVHLIKWAPQPSILAHPKCLFFISHGGLLSSTEAIHFGVPVIGVPIYFDQFNNINKAVSSGYALKTDLTYDLANHLKNAIQEMLSNPKYKQRIKELSFIYHHRPASPGAELVHWTEHVILTRGAPHLRSPALHVPWYQKMYLDLTALVAVVLLIFIKAIKSLCKAVKSKPIQDEKKKK